MSQINPNQSSPATQAPSPSKPSIFTEITYWLLEMLGGAAIRSFGAYLIWNVALASELHMQQFNYGFFFGACLFLKMMFYSSDTPKILLQLIYLNKTLNDLFNLTFFEISRQINIQQQGSVNQQKSSEEKLDKLV